MLRVLCKYYYSCFFGFTFPPDSWRQILDVTHFGIANFLSKKCKLACSKQPQKFYNKARMLTVTIKTHIKQVSRTAFFYSSIPSSFSTYPVWLGWERAKQDIPQTHFPVPPPPPGESQGISRPEEMYNFSVDLWVYHQRLLPVFQEVLQQKCTGGLNKEQ